MSQKVEDLCFCYLSLKTNNQKEANISVTIECPVATVSPFPLGVSQL